MNVRVRFAPSPTGYLHVGGLRTALYNYLFARRYNGKFILRIEDTDRSRYVENALENLLDSLQWAGLDYDEGPGKGGNYGPYIQSQRLDIYKKHADILIEKGLAYYSFDSVEELTQMREKMEKQGLTPMYERKSMKNQFTIGLEVAKKLIEEGNDYVVRLLVPENRNVIFDDIIRGSVTVNTSEIDDQVLLKSDGYPTYHLANVVDDHLMEITHVIRGEEWLPSTPKHILIYEAFGWEKPKFAHLPLLLNMNKKKLSKREGDVSVEYYASKGYFKETIINFVALLGWNPTGDREIYDINELIENFNLEKVNKGGAVFDIEKLNWMNFQYLKQKDTMELALELEPYLRKLGYENFDLEYIERVIALHRERVNFLREIPEFCPYMFSPPNSYDWEYYNKYKRDNTRELLISLKEKYESTNNFTHDTLLEITKSTAELNGLKLKDIIHPLRLAITGRSAGAGMFETMEILGKQECLNRLDGFIKKIESYD